MPSEVPKPFVMDMNAAHISAPWMIGAVLLGVNNRGHQRGGRKRFSGITRTATRPLVPVQPCPASERILERIETSAG
jgi:hypothetical protein